MALGCLVRDRYLDCLSSGAAALLAVASGSDRAPLRVLLSHRYVVLLVRRSDDLSTHQVRGTAFSAWDLLRLDGAVFHSLGPFSWLDPLAAVDFRSVCRVRCYRIHRAAHRAWSPNEAGSSSPVSA